MKGKLVILSGPSGVGKDTVIDAWRQRNPKVERVVAATTRSPRPHEISGVDYHFLSPEEFKVMADQGELLEYKFVHGNWYGTPISQLEDGLAMGKIMLLKIDVQGALTVLPLRPEALSIFLLPPSDEELESRLRSRHTETAAQIEERLRTARDEIKASDQYQYKVVNEVVDQTVDRLEEIVNA